MTAATTKAVPLLRGSHTAPSLDVLAARNPDAVEACVMERAFLRWAFREGMPLEDVMRGWTDHLACVSPIIGSACRSFNDRVGTSEAGNARRARVFTAEVQDALLDTAGSAALEQRRRYALADWGIRVATPRMAALSPGLAPWAEKLRALPEIVDTDTLVASRTVTYAMRDAAWGIRRDQWAECRKKYAEAAAEAEAAAAAAAAAAEAEAAAEAAAAAAEAAAFTPDVWIRAAEAAKKARSDGKTWSRQEAAARAIFDEALAANGGERLVALRALRDELDAGFSALILRLCAMREVA